MDRSRVRILFLPVSLFCLADKVEINFKLELLSDLDDIEFNLMTFYDHILNMDARLDVSEDLVGG